MNAKDVIINAIAGASLAFVGSIIISLFHAPKLLDDDRQKEIDRRDETIESLGRKPYDEKFQRMVREKMRNASPSAQELLKFMLDHGEMDINFVTISTGNHHAAGHECYCLGFLDKREFRPGNGLVARETYYKLKDNFHDVLKDIFYPGS